MATRFCAAICWTTRPRVRAAKTAPAPPMAMALAILKSDTVKNSELECLFTVDEETGLYGATNIKEGWLKAKTLINLDSEEEGEFCIGCAGGRDTIGELKFETEEPSDSLYFFSVTVSGLVGGHSGEDINKNRGNSIKIIGEYLNRLNEQCGVRITHIKGGNLRNAIPRYAEAVVAVPFSQKETAIVAANIFGAELQKTYAGTDDKDVDIKIESHAEKERVMSMEISDRLIKAIMDCPHGVIEMSKEIPGLVDTSTNLAAVSIKDSTIIIETSQRSPSESGKEKASKAVGKVLDEMGAKTTYGKDYPGWEPNFKSDIVKKCCNDGLITQTDVADNDLGNGYGVEYVRFSGSSSDSLVSFVCKLEGLLDDIKLHRIAASLPRSFLQICIISCNHLVILCVEFRNLAHIS